MLFESLPAALQVFLEGLFRSTWSLLGASWSVLGASWSVLGASWSQLGASWAALGGSWAPLGRLLEPTWTTLGTPCVRFGASWELLDPTWLLLGASWTQLGASWSPLGLHLAVPIDLSAPSEFHSVSKHFVVALRCRNNLHCQQSSFRISFVMPEGLPSTTILQLYSPRAVKCNSKALSTKLHVAGWRHMQH